MTAKIEHPSLKERKKAYRAAHPEKVSSWKRRYWEANRENILARRREKYAADPEQMRAKVRQYYIDNPARALLVNARARAKQRGVAFDLTLEDVSIPDVCPVLGLEIRKGVPGASGGSDNSPSLDRIRPELGYVPGNVVVVSHRANRIKQDATADELELVARWLRKASS